MHFFKFRALLATARIANVPSVVSNVWLGAALGLLAGEWKAIMFSGGKAAILCLAGIMLYIAGNFLNDWMDRAWDQQHRPERALPSGLFPPRLYLHIALILIVSGILLAGSVHWLASGVAAIIVSCIVIYTVWHKRAAWAVIPMGFCRALLPMMGALGMLKSGSQIACTATLAGVGAVSLFSYIVGLSLSARNESIANPPPSLKILPRCLFAVPAILMVLPFFIFHEFYAQRLIGVLPYLLWMTLCLIVFRQPISKHVSALLAGIPLVDWIFLLPVALGMLYANHSMDFTSAACLLIPPLAFIAALLLQKIAPAT
jgi:hypothetical protein